MTIPSQNFTILQNGIGFGTNTGGKNTLILGAGTSGTIGAIQNVSSPIKAKELYGYSPLGEAAAFVSKYAPANTFALEIASSKTELTSEAMTESETSPDITLDGYGEFECELKIKIISTTVFQFSLDNGITYSQNRVIPQGSTFVIPTLGLTASFASGTYVADSVYSYSVEGPKCSLTDIDDAFLLIRQDPRKFGAVVLYDGTDLVSDSSTKFALLKVELESAKADYTYMRAVMDFGSATSDKSTVITAINVLESDRISCICDNSLVYSALNREGLTVGTYGLILPYIARLAKCETSEDPGQVDRGSLDGIYSIENDARINNNGLDDAKLVTPMTYKGKTGYYVTNSWLKSASGSDFRYIQHGKVMDLACTVVYDAQTNFLKVPLLLKAGGYLDDVDAIRFEEAVKSKLSDTLLSPINSGGFAGHVSNLAYAIDRTNNVASSETLITTVYLRPLGYANVISTTIGFNVQI
jgi:hypothetical protein